LTGTWTLVGGGGDLNAPSARTNHAMVSVGADIYVFGGDTGKCAGECKDTVSCKCGEDHVFMSERTCGHSD